MPNRLLSEQYYPPMTLARSYTPYHPGLLTEWGKVTVTWWSHSIKGLHRNDFIMAARTDEVSHAAEGRK